MSLNNKGIRIAGLAFMSVICGCVYCGHLNPDG